MIEILSVFANLVMNNATKLQYGRPASDLC